MDNNEQANNSIPVDEREVLIQEIAELEAIQSQLITAKNHAEQRENLESAFLANMSHEIRTPLNAIVGFSNLLIAQDISEEERKNYVYIINKSSNQLLNLISDIIDISKIKSEQLNINVKQTSAGKVLKNIFEVFSKQMSPSVKLIMNTPRECADAIILADDIRLAQILNNLLSNALKFTENGSIEFGYKIPDNNFIEFYVKDSGIGISTENQKIIFDRFRQADDPYTKKTGGTGLGLAICKNLVELMSGKIRVVSEYAVGSVFYFTLPCVSIEETASMQRTNINLNLNIASQKYKWTGKKILLVDDTKICLKYLQALLKDSQLQMFFAESAQEAVSRFTENPDIDIILMDIQMPGENGLDATLKIKKIRPDVPVIAQTAYAFTDDKNNFIAAGCNDYISKPINSVQLMEKIDFFLSAHETT
ncbi:MAG: ATP-binding protein [Victivallaceae bacterium]